MTGVKAPAAVLGTTTVLATHAAGKHAPTAHVLGGIVGTTARGTLPFTGIALGVYLALGLSLVLAGLVLRVTARV